MQRIDTQQYLQIRKGATVLEADSHGDKVLLLSDGNYLKLFRRKRRLSSAALWPYAQRFANNANALCSRNIPCPTILGVYRIAETERDAVHYAPLAGQTLRALITQGNAAEPLRKRLAEFVAVLHANGVYFRSLHLGNIVLTPDNELGLIDIADMRCQSRPLSKQQRIRNFQHMLRYQGDREWLLSPTANSVAFLSGYLTKSRLKMTLQALQGKLGILPFTL